MTGKECIKEILKKNGTTMSALGEAVGKTKYTMSMSFSKHASQSIKASDLVEMLEVLGYKLVAVPKVEKVKGIVIDE